MILVTGATEPIGREVVRQLSRLTPEVPFEVMATDPQGWSLPEGKPHLVYGRFDDYASMEAAFDGVESLFLHSPADEKQLVHEMVAIEVARKKNVRHIVRVSRPAWAQTADARAASRFCEHQWILDQALKSSNRQGPAYTILRPHQITQLLIDRVGDEIARDGRFTLPVTDSRVSVVDIHDVAEVVVATLTKKDHRRCDYTLTGPEGVLFSDFSIALSEHLGRRVPFRTEPLWWQRLRRLFVGDDFVAEDDAVWAAAISRGAEAEVTTTIEAILKRPPRPLMAYIKEISGPWISLS